METIDIKGITYRYYVTDRKMDHDEDDTVEFKGHLNFTKEQVPPYALDPMYNRPSRQPVSKWVKFNMTLFYTLGEFECYDCCV